MSRMVVISNRVALPDSDGNPAPGGLAVAVEAAMRHYAALLGGDVELWGITGLIHDFDYERWPNPPDHTREGARILRERGVNEEIIGAILSHAEWNQADYPRDRPIRKALFAVDELMRGLGWLLTVPTRRNLHVNSTDLRRFP